MSKWEVGQQVIVRSAGYDRLATIDRITPSGRVIVGNRQFTPSGTEYGRSQDWHPDTIREATPEAVLAITCREIRRRMANSIEVNRLTSDQLVRIAAILDEEPTP